MPRQNYKNSSGSIYGSGSQANFEVRRHSLKRTFEINPGKAKLIPLLTQCPAEPAGTTIEARTKIASLGTKIYPTICCEKDSTVKAMHIDLMAEPKSLSDAAIIDLYIATGTFSFHDIRGGRVYGLESDDTDRLQYTDEAQNPNTTFVVTSTGGTNDPPELDLNIETYNYGDIIKHWWSPMQKTIMVGGQPMSSSRWRKIPGKCRRMNPGTFWGMLILNDARDLTGDSDILHLDIKQEFMEIPLIQ